ncbi:hypothetical protein [Desulfosarcina alkanivorans]|uniref:hypothetical protein n=1 Tax=Desulfosarcina alkanivorans TaxID=571177 RepID=UPI0012D2A47A|nr:hypothetical protein [Desulfosarcina alkanivorans]
MGFSNHPHAQRSRLLRIAGLCTPALINPGCDGNFPAFVPWVRHDAVFAPAANEIPVKNRIGPNWPRKATVVVEEELVGIDALQAMAILHEDRVTGKPPSTSRRYERGLGRGRYSKD